MLNLSLWRGLNATQSDSLEVHEIQALPPLHAGALQGEAWREVQDQYLAHAFPRWVAPACQPPPHPPPACAWQGMAVRRWQRMAWGGLARR